MILLTLDQVNRILSTSHYASSFTETWTQYRLYRGRLNTSVLTLRFNLTLDPTVMFMTHVMENHLLTRFPRGSQVLVSINYDLLLRQSDGPPSYYLWRANSNRHRFNKSEEFVLTLTTYHINAFIQRLIRGPNMNDLNINFINSKVVVDRVLFVVCSFMSL